MAIVILSYIAFLIILAIVTFFCVRFAGNIAAPVARRVNNELNPNKEPAASMIIGGITGAIIGIFVTGIPAWILTKCYEAFLDSLETA